MKTNEVDKLIEMTKEGVDAKAIDFNRKLKVNKFILKKGVKKNMITETKKFMTEKVPVSFYRKGERSGSGIATVIWTTGEEWRSWGLKSMGVTIERVMIDYDTEDDEGNTESHTQEFAEDIKAIRDNIIPLYPHEVVVTENKVTVDFGGF